MPNISSFGAQTDNAVVQGTVTDRQMIIPEVPPQGLMSVGPRVTFNYIEDEWNANTSYQFYDVVRDAAGASYVAIRPAVPTGTALTDTNYWFKWADPNAQFAELQEVVKTYNQRITSNTENIAQNTENIAQNTLNIAQNTADDYILLGDSLARGYVNAETSVDGWIDKAISILKNRGKKVYAPTIIPGAPAFTGGATWLSLLQAITTDIPDARSIKHIIIMGGSNERNNNNIADAISQFMSYVNKTFPNAEVKLGVLCAYQGGGRVPIADQYKKIVNYGGIFMQSLTNLICNMQYVSKSDGTHLTPEGYAYYNPFIIKLIFSDNINYSFNFRVPISISTEGFSLNGTAYIDVTVTPANVMYSITGGNNLATLTGFQNGNYKEITIAPKTSIYLAKTSFTMKPLEMISIEKSTKINSSMGKKIILYYTGEFKLIINPFIYQTTYEYIIPMDNSIEIVS